MLRPAVEERASEAEPRREQAFGLLDELELETRWEEQGERAAPTRGADDERTGGDDRGEEEKEFFPHLARGASAATPRLVEARAEVLAHHADGARAEKADTRTLHEARWPRTSLFEHLTDERAEPKESSAERPVAINQQEGPLSHHAEAEAHPRPQIPPGPASSRASKGAGLFDHLADAHAGRRDVPARPPGGPFEHWVEAGATSHGRAEVAHVGEAAPAATPAARPQEAVAELAEDRRTEPDQLAITVERGIRSGEDAIAPATTALHAHAAEPLEPDQAAADELQALRPAAGAALASAPGATAGGGTAAQPAGGAATQAATARQRLKQSLRQRAGRIGARAALRRQSVVAAAQAAGQQAAAGGAQTAAAAQQAGATTSAATGAKTALQLASVQQALQRSEAELEQQLQAEQRKVAGHLEAQTRRLHEQLGAESQRLEARAAAADASLAQQIAARRTQMEAQAEDQVASLTMAAAGQAGLVRERGQAERAQQLAGVSQDLAQNAQQGRAEIAGVRGKASMEARGAREQGAIAAAQAVAWAAARAVTLTDKAEQEACMAQGRERAEAARARASIMAGVIENRSTLAVARLEARVARDAAGAAVRGGRGAGGLMLETESQASAVEAGAREQATKLRAQVQVGVAAMQGERQRAHAEAQHQRAQALQGMTARLQVARSGLETTAAEARAGLEQRVAKQREEARARAGLAAADLARAKGQDLVKAERRATAATRAIERSAARLQRKIDAASKDAQKKLRRQVDHQLQGIASEGQQALDAIDLGLAQTTRQVEAQAGQTAARVDIAADDARAGVQRAGKDAREAVAGQAAGVAAENGARARFDRAQTSQEAARSGAAMHADSGRVAREAQTQWVADAVREAKGKLAGWDPGGRDAVHAMNTLNSLPPAAQEAAVRQLDGESFDGLLERVPEARRKEFKSLYLATSDPVKKVRLWGEAHKSQARADLEQMASEDRPQPGDTAQDLKDRATRAMHREAIAAGTRVEVDDEVKTVRALAMTRAMLPNGSAATMTEVNRAIERKAEELKLEKKYGVNLTHTAGNDFATSGPEARESRVPEKRRVWSVPELAEVDSVLGRLPDAHVKNNPALNEIKRGDFGKRWDAQNAVWQDTGAAADTLHGRIRVFDGGAKQQLGTMSVLQSDLAARSPTGATPHGPVSNLEQGLTHEIGHVMGPARPDARAAVRRTSWEADGRTPLPGGIPTENRRDHSWDYARTSPDEHFAELYTKMANAPERTRHDLITDPASQVRDFSQRAGDAARLLMAAAHRGDPGELAAAQALLAQANGGMVEAQQRREAGQEQWRTLRSDVFGTDDHVRSMIEARRARGGATMTATEEEILRRFEAQADLAATPYQADRLLETTEADVLSEEGP